MKKIVFFCLFLVGASTYAQLTSTFDVDVDGWTLADFNILDPQTMTFNGSGGNPGGFASGTKTSTSQSYYFTSPSKFGGSITYFSYGQDLTFDIQINHVGAVHSPNGDVLIRIPSGQTLAINLPSFPAQAPAWSTFTVRLDETVGWRVGGTTGPLATKQIMLEYLAQVQHFRFNINYRSGVTSPGGGVDNVILNQRSITPTPAISSFSPTSGKTGQSITISGTNFGAAAGDNAVYFGGVAGTIVAESATTITATVPIGAQYAPLMVVNKVTGRSIRSLVNFNPLFDGGGRIIPSSFKSNFTIDLTGGYGSLSLADMDGDGWTDIVVAARDNSAIRVYRNLALGGTLSTASFAAPVSFATTLSFTNGSGLSTVDFDNDGKLDMATSGWTGGPGAFATFRNISTPGTLAFEPVEKWNGLTDESPVNAAIDVDGDGLIDLVSGEGSSPGATWINQNISTPGNIEFAFRKQFFGNNSHQGATLGDLNGDGMPEFIHKIQNVLNQQDIYTNTSTPGTISFGSSFTLPVAIQGSMIVFDFNKDGKNDLAWKDGFSNNDIHIRLNTNSGGPLSLADFSTEIILDSETSSYGGASLGDINGDGKPDILASDTERSAVFENIYSGGAFGANAFIPGHLFPGIVPSTYPVAPLAADLNGDQKPDLVVGYTNTSPNKIAIYENQNVAAPYISVTTVSPLAAPIGNTVTITGSGFSPNSVDNFVYFGAVQANILAANSTTLTVSVPVGASYAPVRVRVGELSSTYHLPFKTTFSPGVTFNSTHFAPPITFTLTNADYDIDITDIDLDGKPDIAAEATSQQMFFFRNTHNLGAITAGSLTAAGSTGNTTTNGKFLDVDGNGLDEIIGVNGLMYRNNSSPGSVSFGSGVSLSFGANNSAFADFNLDGKMEMAATSGTQLIVLENRSISGSITAAGTFGSFANSIAFTKPGTGGGIVAADFDADGYADVIATNPNTNNLSIFRNNKAPRINASSFAARVDIATGTNPGRVYTGDFDSDGKLDLVIYYGTGASSTTITVFHNQSTVGTIAFTSFNLTMPSASTVAHVDDLDGDGKPEIIVTSETGNRFSIFENIHTSGALTAASFAAPFNTTITAPRGINTADINGDGKPEIVLTQNVSGGQLVVYQNLIANPTITSFLPTSGPIGTQVVITGTNFNTTPTNNSVQFNGITAYLVSSTATSITAIVPPGATTGPISVTVSNNMAISASNFTIVRFACPPGTRQGGDLDATFNPLVQTTATFTAVEMQSTGKIIVAAPAVTINGNSYEGILRFESNGALDASFTTSVHDPSNQQLIVRPDDKVIVVKNGEPTAFISRLNPNGSPDPSFNGPVYDNTSTYDIIIGPLATQSDGKLLYSFTNTFDFIYELARLNADGSLDASFSAPMDLNANVIKQQTDGKILLAGSFGVVRLDPSGSIDPTFTTVTGLDGTINDMVLQSNGKIVVIGTFTKIAGLPARNIARLNSDGNIDTSFLAGNGFSLYTGAQPITIKLLPGDQLVVAGEFTSYNETARTRLLVLNADGSLQCSFDPQAGPNTPLEDAAVQPDGKILIVGSFSDYDGTARNAFARVNGITASCVPASERAALIALYNSTNGAAWADKTNWLSADESTWSGVIVTGCNVTGLFLQNNNLVGTLPPELGNLTKLKTLFIIRNSNLTGSIPASIGNLAELTTLALWDNQLTGNIPSSLGSLSSLTDLQMMNNKLTGSLPTQLGNLSAIQTIRLDGNQLTGSIPSSLFNLAALKSLELGANQLSGTLSPAISNLTNLEALGLSGNQFSGTLPNELGNLIKLTRLQLGVNQFSGNLPASIGNLVNLTAFSVFNNQLTGTVPSSLSNLINLNGLGLSVNQFTGAVPPGIGLIPNLNDVSLRDNDFTSIPNFVSNSFTDLLVYGNKLNFSHLEPNIGKTGFVYSPQDNLPGGTASACVGTTLTISFSTPGTANSYQWYKDGVLITGATSTNFVKSNVTVADAGNYTVRVSNSIVTGLTLQSDNFVVTVNSIPASPVANPVSVCPAGTATLTATGGTNGQYRWYTAASGGTAIAGQTNSTFVTPNISVVTTFYVSVLIGTCESTRTVVVVTPIGSACAPPTITSTSISITIGDNKTLDLKTLITTPSGTIDINSITVAVPPPSGAIATITGGVLTLDYKGVVFVGKEKITIRACDSNGNCSTQQIEIEVVGEIVVYNAVSPNGDGKNEFLMLQFIESISPKNQVSIYNRWGDEVFSISDYDNKTRVFAGLSSGGSRLPAGTYFYKVTLASDQKIKTGFISLK